MNPGHPDTSTAKVPPREAGGGADGPALQDRLAVHCYGCGTLNARGLHIKSHRQGAEQVCVWQPWPDHVGYPGRVYGGVIASVVDCHAVWTAWDRHCRDVGHELGCGPPPFAMVTARLQVTYLRPAAVSQPLQLRARVVEHGPRKSLVACSVRQGELECAVAEVLAVRVDVPG